MPVCGTGGVGAVPTIHPIIMLACWNLVFITVLEAVAREGLGVRIPSLALVFNFLVRIK
jgi:hypothetical protein